MKLLEGSYESWVPPEGGAAVTVGVYDGVHRGHQAVLAHLRTRADELGGLPVVVLTFDRHPLELLAPDRAPKLITTLDAKIQLLAAQGVDAVAVLGFDDDVRTLDADDFVADVLVGALGATVVAVGADFRFGLGRRGDVESLRDLGLGLGYFVEEVGLLGDETPISSTTIRAALAAGDVDDAAGLLGRPFSLTGEVVEGDKRGRSIGFPTANIVPPERLAVPADGVYTADVDTVHGRHPAVVNIGVRPTFGGGARVVEAHLLDVDLELYGTRIEIHFIGRLRGERRFEGVDALVAQIGKDVDEGRTRLTSR